ncbi:Skp family chaperone for outer membrane proteins [Lutibacter oceani]|uniref:Skp family chaperone for outer membrane proteins n=1 Tax=Lutibacter oceani TaxID=1853311 RepID=A0A3D9RLI8_9FLAO|nr:OmpH family outer membrane protein [Lutibacter oceani]REE80743.1 Skp family chaperone for outer membrane proteins [Lutibacter oceani]
MTKKVLLFAFVILSFSSIAQKAQRIGYIDMEYILENIPEYNEAQSKLNSKALTWQNNIEKLQQEIEALKAELNIEKALMTKELILDKEEDIQIKNLELKKMQDSYFGVNGDLFLLRQQLVQPIQDLVYNAIQDIAVKRKYDFVLDKSTDLIMLYTNSQYDISELVIKNITKEKKLDAIKEKQKGINSGVVNSETDSQENIETAKKLDEREAKKAALQQRIEDKRAAQLKKREELKKAIEAKRLKRIKDIEDAKKAQEEKNKNN